MLGSHSQRRVGAGGEIIPEATGAEYYCLFIMSFMSEDLYSQSDASLRTVHGILCFSSIALDRSRQETGRS